MSHENILGCYNKPIKDCMSTTPMNGSGYLTFM